MRASTRTPGAPGPRRGRARHDGAWRWKRSAGSGARVRASGRPERDTTARKGDGGAEHDRRQGKRHGLPGVWTRACEPLGSQGAARPVVAELAVACQERHPRLAQVWVAHACAGTWFPRPRHSAAERARCGGATALAPARKVGTGRPRAGYGVGGGGAWRPNCDTGSKVGANGGQWPTGVLGEARRDAGWFVAETRRCRAVQLTIVEVVVQGADPVVATCSGRRSSVSPASPPWFFRLLAWR